VTAATTSSRASLTGIGADSSGARAYDRELADAMAFPVGSPEYEAANLVITGRDPDHELTGDELVAAIREVEEILRQPGTWSKLRAGSLPSPGRQSTELVWPRSDGDSTPPVRVWSRRSSRPKP
jgi:hypothetical protein